MVNETKSYYGSVKIIFYRIGLLLLLVLLLGGCGKITAGTGEEGSLTLNDIAYDVNKDLGYTVYLMENEEYVPYLVLTNDYDGSVLLLREYLLPDSLVYDTEERYTGYYENSSIDEYLIGEFFSPFSSDMQEKIIDSQITITDLSSLGSCGTKTTQIIRKVFLLSHTELNLQDSSVAPEEGRPLKYFDSPSSRIARFETQEASGWWLRTSYTWYKSTAWSVGYDATVGGGGVSYKNGVRPAFCMDKKTPINERKDIITDKTIYVMN